mgnify:CR=1 FL=1
MLKKRVIFTLLYDSGYFMLSRNFRLQKVGDMQWLKKNYNFSHIAFSIDELIILSRMGTICTKPAQKHAGPTHNRDSELICFSLSRQ